jgi:hypothetical protein
MTNILNKHVFNKLKIVILMLIEVPIKITSSAVQLHYTPGIKKTPTLIRVFG